MKTLAVLIAVLIGFSTMATYDRDQWEALTEDEQIQIIKRLVILYATENGVREVDVLIKYEGNKVIILIKTQTSEV